jgi:hypothetical protein
MGGGRLVAGKIGGKDERDSRKKFPEEIQKRGFGWLLRSMASIRPSVCMGIEERKLVGIGGRRYGVGLAWRGVVVEMLRRVKS